MYRPGWNSEGDHHARTDCRMDSGAPQFREIVDHYGARIESISARRTTQLRTHAGYRLLHDPIPRSISSSKGGCRLRTGVEARIRRWGPGRVAPPSTRRDRPKRESITGAARFGDDGRDVAAGARGAASTGIH